MRKPILMREKWTLNSIRAASYVNQSDIFFSEARHYLAGWFIDLLHVVFNVAELHTADRGAAIKPWHWTNNNVFNITDGLQTAFQN